MKKKSEDTLGNLISTQDDQNIEIAPDANRNLYLPYYKQEIHFINNTEYIKFVKSVENLIRRSKEYRAYIRYLKEDVGLRQCVMFGNITDDKASIEMHHGPIFTLFDYVELTIVNEFKKPDGFVSSFRVANQVLEDHFNNLIQVVMLSEMAHKAVHPSKKEVRAEFIDIDSAWGDIVGYLQKYSHCVNYSHARKIKKYINEWEKQKKDDGRTVSIFREIVKKWKF